MKRYFFTFVLMLSAVCLHAGDRIVIARVVDGDTVVCVTGETIRIIGIDAPEIAHNGIDADPFGEEAARFAQKILLGKKVTLEPGRESEDRYGRTLAYIRLPDGTDAGALLLQNGYARVYLKFAFERKSEYLRLEEEARREKRGMWQMTGGGTRPSDAVKIDWRDAKNFAGKTIECEGIIVSAKNTGRTCFLNFSNDFKRGLTVIIKGRDLPRFEKSPEKEYRGRRVKIWGTVVITKGRPEIIITAPAQIERQD